MRLYKKFELKDHFSFQHLLLEWLRGADRVAFLNSNDLEKKYGTYDFLGACGVANEFYGSDKDAIPAFKQFFNEVPDWLFGFFSYDLKNNLENLSSNHADSIKMPLIHFFQPQLVFLKKHNTLDIGYLPEFHSEQQIDEIFAQISIIDLSKIKTEKVVFEKITAKVSKEVYLNTFDTIKKHIQRGDIYEMNYCTAFFTHFSKSIEVVDVYKSLNTLSPAPFSCLYKLDDKALICASPERFLKKTGQKLISQPIKGTIKRGKTKEEDIMLALELANSEKEKSENVMIVDLVRNDMSHYAKMGSVQVEELFGIYSYAQVHQMISTIVCELENDSCPVDVIMQCFPPGSMTGAPKIRAMQIIETTENTKRGLYAGAVGYFTSEKDFDFNVVIRSILINNTEKQASFMAGGAITAASEAEKEYEECLLKACAMNKTLD